MEAKTTRKEELRKQSTRTLQVITVIIVTNY
jgi:hypothetical protein